MIGKNYLSHAIKKLGGVASPDLENYVIDKASRCELLEGLLNVLEEAIVIFDRRKNITFHNLAFARAFAPGHEKLTGRGIDEVFEDISAEGESPFPDEELAPGQSIFKEIRTTLPAPRVFACKIIPARLGKDEDCLFTAILSDITRLKQNQENRLQSAKLGSFSLLAAGIAHEIGNPLNALGLNLQLMEKSLDADGGGRAADDMLAPMVRTCMSEVERLDTIVKKFLKTVRPLVPEKKACRLNNIVTDVIGFMRADMAGRGIDCVLELDPNLPESMMDPVYMHKAVLNIVKNAIESIHGPNGRIRVRSFLRQGMLTLEIGDNGEGITDDNLGRVMEPYYTTKADGSGLGLMMTYKSVQEHDGTLEIKSGETTGTTVTISLPVRKGRERACLPPSKKRPRPDEGRKKGRERK